MLRSLIVASAVLALSASAAIGQESAPSGMAGQDNSVQAVRPGEVGAASGGLGIISAPSAADYKKAYDQGLAALAASDWKLAQRRFNFVVKGYPNDADAQAYLGYSARRNNDPKKAQKAFDKALKVDPAHLIANVDYGKWLVEQNNLPEARNRLASLQACCANKPETKDLAAAIAAKAAATPAG